LQAQQQKLNARKAQKVQQKEKKKDTMLNKGNVTSN
jgi:hypothetical protein